MLIYEIVVHKAGDKYTNEHHIRNAKNGNLQYIEYNSEFIKLSKDIRRLSKDRITISKFKARFN